MFLKKFEYHEFDGQPKSWSLENFTLETINLLVGKNATGKTNTIQRIAWLGNMLTGLLPNLLISGNYYAEFADNDDVYKYYLNLINQMVEMEKLVINGNEMFTRSSDGIGQINAIELPGKIRFQLPLDQLVAVSRRDKIQHPYLQKLTDWADGLRMYSFSSSLGKDTGFTDNNSTLPLFDSKDPNLVAGLYVKGEQEYPGEFKRRILKSMAEIGYRLKDMGVGPNPNLILHVINLVHVNMIYIVENDANLSLFQPDISQGMFRALSLIINVIYNTLKNQSTTILIDDIGEGLDFDRSTKLIKLLINLAEQSNIQLIMTTNDRFVMNAVPLEYWQVIQRSGGKCKIYNYENSKEIFDEFAYTGLNNFDFLANDFINSIKEYK